MLLDQVLPRWHHRERHSIAGAIPLAAAREVTLAEVPLVRLLFRLRGIPLRATVLESVLALGFEIAADSEDELVVAHSPSWGRLAMNLRVEPGSLSTETRVLLAGRRARLAFLPYWVVVRPFSGLIRRLWLGAALRRARRG
jgi:hypothetical protein